MSRDPPILKLCTKVHQSNTPLARKLVANRTAITYQLKLVHPTNAMFVPLVLTRREI